MSDDRTKTLLNVNDDEATRYTTTRVLKSAGFRVIEADTGGKALALADEEQPELIILDVKLPDLSGFEVCRRLKGRSSTAHIPILHLSAHRISSHDKAAGLDGGADGYLVQPVEPVELIAAVRALLRTREARASAERAAQLTSRLQEVTAALSEAVTPVEVTEVVVRQGTAALGASAGFLAELSPDGAALELIGGLGYPAAWFEEFRHIPLDSNLPVAHAARHKEPLWLRSSDEIRDKYPNIESRRSSEALVAIPLVVRGQLFGALGLSYQSKQSFGDEERAFILTLARLCAQALMRARLFRDEHAARALAEEAVRVRDEFLAIASHELKNPLSALQLQVQNALRKGPSYMSESDKFHERLKTMDRSVLRLSRLVDDLLDVSRLSAGRLELVLERVDLTEVVDEVVGRANDELARTRSTIQLDRDGLLVGRWDRSRVDQIASNLLSNAIKYGQGKPITVTLGREDDHAVLRVRDEGVGLAPEDRERIFNRFERAQSTRHIRGLGLGLWIVREIVRAMGGSISADGAPGKGSTFTVRLPLAGPTPSTGAQSR